MICVALQYCPECAEKLTTPIDNKPLDPQFRLLLKCTIPYPDDDDEETSTVAGDEEETDLQKLAEKFAVVDSLDNVQILQDLTHPKILGIYQKSRTCE